MTEVAAVLIVIGLAAYVAALVRDFIAYNKIMRKYEDKKNDR